MKLRVLHRRLKVQCTRRRWRRRGRQQICRAIGKRRLRQLPTLQVARVSEHYKPTACWCVQARCAAVLHRHGSRAANSRAAELRVNERRVERGARRRWGRRVVAQGQVRRSAFERRLRQRASLEVAHGPELHKPRAARLAQARIAAVLHRHAHGTRIADARAVELGVGERGGEPIARRLGEWFGRWGGRRWRGRRWQMTLHI